MKTGPHLVSCEDTALLRPLAEGSSADMAVTRASIVGRDRLRHGSARPPRWGGADRERGSRSQARSAVTLTMAR